MREYGSAARRTARILSQLHVRGVPLCKASTYCCLAKEPFPDEVSNKIRARSFVHEEGEGLSRVTLAPLHTPKLARDRHNNMRVWSSVVRGCICSGACRPAQRSCAGPLPGPTVAFCSSTQRALLFKDRYGAAASVTTCAFVPRGWHWGATAAVVASSTEQSLRHHQGPAALHGGSRGHLHTGSCRACASSSGCRSRTSSCSGSGSKPASHPAQIHTSKCDVC